MRFACHSRLSTLLYTCFCMLLWASCGGDPAGGTPDDGDTPKMDSGMPDEGTPGDGDGDGDG
ncbi:MAG: hypothetical protein OXU20_15505, partial [Myxococcales bacterium]|nr:hypothetical protein [Myxococcales bacterium]